MKKNKLISRILFIIYFFLISSIVNSEEKNSKINNYSGMFGFSGTGKK